jgi:hypothetical protein
MQIDLCHFFMNKFIQKNRERIDFNGQILDFMCLVPSPNFPKVSRTSMENPNGKTWCKMKGASALAPGAKGIFCKM